MSWIEVKATLPQSPDFALFIEAFREHGIENTLEDAESLVGAIANVQGADDTAAKLEVSLRALGAIRVQSRELPEENWELAWRVFFKPRRVGKHFVVRPTWETHSLQPGDVEIVLDPGQAFGTGDHPTTRLCLELLEDAGVAGSRVCDVGCGSGILSVAVCKLGANSVHSVDIEPISVEVAKENAALNNVDFDAVVGEGLEPVREYAPFDVVVSNIISAILIRLARDVTGCTEPGSRWLVSGIIDQNWADVQEAAEAAGFNLLEKREEDGWVAALFVRR